MKKNIYIKFVFNFFKFILIVALLDYAIGGVLRYYYFKQTSGLQFRTTYAIDSTNADILIFGSSRANHHYHPDVFESRLKQSYYNAGRDGNFIFYHTAVLQAILQRRTPKIVILDFVNEEFKSGQYSYDRLSSLLPYYKNHPEMRSIIGLRGPFEKFKLLSKIYPYNSSLFTIAVGNASFNKARKSEKQGYVPLTATLKDSNDVQNVVSGAYETDAAKIRYYESFIEACLKAGINVYIVCSPYFTRSPQRDYSVMKAKEIAGKYQIAFFDHSEDTLFNHKALLFADRIHLNDKGARIFSNLIVDEILSSKQKNAAFHTPY